MVCPGLSSIKGTEILMASLTVLCGVSILCITTITTYIIHTTSKLQTSNNYIILTLFWSDTINAVIISVIRVSILICDAYTKSKCVIVVIFTRFLSYISTGCLVFVTLERFLRLLYYKIYHHYINKQRTIRGLAVLVVISLLVSTLVEVNWNLVSNKNNELHEPIPHCTYAVVMVPGYGFVSIIFVQLLPFFVISLMYINIMMFVRKRLFQRPLDCSETRTERRNFRRLRADTKIAISVMAIVGSYIVLVIPIVVTDLIKFKNDFLNPEDRTIVSQKIMIFVVVLAILYPAVEGIVFLGTSKQFWKPIGIVMGISQLRNRPTSNSVTTTSDHTPFSKGINPVMLEQTDIE